jgi:hypothetical protein
MTDFGKWVLATDFLRDTGWTEDRLREEIGAGRLTAKTSAGQELVFVEPETSSSASPVAATEVSATAPPGPGSALAETLPGEPLVSRVTHSQELALQTERALSLVERSMSAFMLMHREVVSEKERSYENYKQALDDRAQELRKKDEAVEELKRIVREKEQEIADLKMLVEILEGRVRRESAPPPPPEHVERASVGDLMEDQLRYIMEDSMIKELLK